jgi:hypothetical protein
MIDVISKVYRRGPRWFLYRLCKEFKSSRSALLSLFKPLLLPLFLKYKSASSGESTSLIAVYDLSVAPPGYNFVEFLQIAELRTKSLKLDSFIVVFADLPSDNINTEYGYSSIVTPRHVAWRLFNLLIPLTACSSLCAGHLLFTDSIALQKYLDDKPNVYPVGYSVLNTLVHDVRDLYHFPCAKDALEGLCPTAGALDYFKRFLKYRVPLRFPVITITLRWYAYDPSRNSRLVDWLIVAKYLHRHGYFPLVLPDTESCWDSIYEPFSEYVYHDFIWNVHLRLAAYSSSYLNLGVQNGPCGMMLASPSCRCILFNSPLDSTELVPNIKSYERNMNVKATDQWPTLQPTQYQAFLPDTAPNIIKTLNNYLLRYPSRHSI